MKRLLLVSLAFAVSGCDRVSQRIWNCSPEALAVTKVLDTGERINDVIPARNYIGSMKGGIQVVALQSGSRFIWQRTNGTKRFATPLDNACEGRTGGLVAEQF
jgi:hypothetical protein